MTHNDPMPSNAEDEGFDTVDEQSGDRSCTATFREEPMLDTVYCGEHGYHQRHTAWEGSNYYAWFDGDEGAGSDSQT